VTPDEILPSSLLAIAVTHTNARTIRVDVAGELDVSTTGRLQAVLLEAIDTSRPLLVIVDLTRVPFLDASGINALITAYNHMGGHPRQLRLVNPQPIVARVLHIVESHDLFDVSSEPQLSR
jgi:anti-sigma B factor antagonist